MSKIIKATVKAWFTNEYHGPDDLKGSPEGAINSLGFHSCPHGIPDGWVHVGEAEITVTVKDARELVEAKVEALHAEKRKVLGDAEAHATLIEARIQNLLAISFDGAA